MDRTIDDVKKNYLVDSNQYIHTVSDKEVRDRKVIVNKLVSQAKESIENEQWSEAISQYKQALSVPGTRKVWIYLAIGRLLVKTERLEEAVVYYEQAASIDPHNPAVYRLLGNVLKRTQKVSGAVASYRKAISIEPLQPAWLHNEIAEALCMASLRNYQHAASHYIQAIYAQDTFDSLSELSNIFHSLCGKGGGCLESLIEMLALLSTSQHPEALLLAQRLIRVGLLSKDTRAVNLSGYYFVSEKLKMIYCSIPKNACTLFKSMIVDNSELRERFMQSSCSVHEFLNREARESSACQLLECLCDESYFKFTVVRNPYDRVVSGYLDKFAKHKLPEGFVQKIIMDVQNYLGVRPNISKSITFSQFVDYLHRTPDHLLNDHWRPQNNFLIDVGFDLVGRFEEMNSVINSVESRFDIKVKRNVSSHATRYKVFGDNRIFCDATPAELRELDGMPTAAQLYTSELRSKIKEKYKKDFEILGYTS